MVEETRTNYLVFGHTESPVDLELLGRKTKQKYVVFVVGGIGCRYTVQEAYLMARSLERGLNTVNKSDCQELPIT